MDIKNKVFIVTGGASGLGAGTARMLVAEGAKVILADVQDEAGQQLASELGQTYVHCNVTSEADGQAVVDAAQKAGTLRSEEHTSELQSLMRISYAVFCWIK